MVILNPETLDALFPLLCPPPVVLYQAMALSLPKALQPCQLRAQEICSLPGSPAFVGQGQGQMAPWVSKETPLQLLFLTSGLCPLIILCRDDSACLTKRT